MAAAAAVCVLCESGGSLTAVMEARNYEYGVPGTYRLARCEECGLFYQPPIPDPGVAPSFYPPTYSVYSNDPTVGWMFDSVFRRDARRSERLIERRGRVLDVGIGAVYAVAFGLPPGATTLLTFKMLFSVVSAALLTLVLPLLSLFVTGAGGSMVGGAKMLYSYARGKKQANPLFIEILYLA